MRLHEYYDRLKGSNKKIVIRLEGVTAIFRVETWKDKVKFSKKSQICLLKAREELFDSYIYALHTLVTAVNTEFDTYEDLNQKLPFKGEE